VVRAGKESDVVEVSLGAHHAVCAGCGEASFEVGMEEDVAVREDGDPDGLLDSGDLVPICEALRGACQR
jgi:hypothetical protein